jgi:hypothetical protein
MWTYKLILIVCLVVVILVFTREIRDFVKDKWKSFKWKD